MLHHQQSRAMIEHQLRQPALFDSSGKATYRSPEGEECLLWIPDGESTLSVYACLKDIEPRVDGRLLARALALNLEREQVGQGSIGLNLQTHQLIFCVNYPVYSDIKVSKLLAEFLLSLNRLRQALSVTLKPKSSTSTAIKSGGHRQLSPPLPLTWVSHKL